MELDLQKIARIRARNFDQASAMNYLLSPIRRELERRIDLAAAESTDSLVIDFLGGDLLQNHAAARRCSLLDASTDVAFADVDFADQSFDCVAINLQSSWLQFDPLIAQARRLLRPGGSLYFSAFGPDTLGELQYGWAQADDLFHVHPFVDMHHLGDALLQAGFVKPIVDADWIYVDYPSIDILFADLKQEGFANIHSQRRKTLTGKHRFEKFKRALAEVATKGSHINITFEIIYGFAELSDRPDMSADRSIRVMPPSASGL
ncbi:methyltransferase domain-containing protein [Candidatus Spongiihabitans sp.]|uniref:methyltransferase domain-containing protein n=1 Tax=Candidatus Spongiihabitans sp. TaxID=3101308 RepID=UPI003C7C5559